MTHKTHSLLLAASVAVAVAAIVLSMAATIVYSKHLASDRRAEQVAGCQRANVQRAFINRLLAAHPELGLPPIEIPVCETIVR